MPAVPKPTNRTFFQRARGRISRDIRFTLLRAYSIVYAALKGVKIGRGTLIYPGAKMFKVGLGEIRIGDHCEFHYGSVVATYGGNVNIGNYVSLNYYSILYGHGGLDIGDNVRIAAQTVMIPSNHNMDPDRLIREQGETSIGIRIGNDVWIGAGVRILDGSDIPDKCVIASSALVVPNMKTEPLGIYGGVPARQISSRARHAKTAG